MTERERQQLQRAKADEIMEALPAWDGKSPSVWVVFVDPDTMRPYARWRTPATAAPQQQPGPRPRLRLVRDAS